MLARSLNFSPDQSESFFQETPAAAAVFLLIGEGEPYVSKTANLRRRLQRLLGPPAEQSKRLNLRDRVRQVEFTPTGSDFESQFLLYLTPSFLGDAAQGMLDLPAPGSLDARLKLRVVSLDRLGDDLRLLARPA